MPFLYDVCNVKLQLYAKGLVWSQEGKRLSKTSGSRLLEILIVFSGEKSADDKKLVKLSSVQLARTDFF